MQLQSNEVISQQDLGGFKALATKNQIKVLNLWNWLFRVNFSLALRVTLTTATSPLRVTLCVAARLYSVTSHSRGCRKCGGFRMDVELREAFESLCADLLFTQMEFTHLPC